MVAVKCDSCADAHVIPIIGRLYNEVLQTS